MCDKKRVDEQSSFTELGDIFCMHGNEYRALNKLTPHMHKVFNAILNCRTSALGGHVDRCDNCGLEHYSYNSCRNRHCPKCETFKSFRWLENKKAELLPVHHFHLVFTLPHDLNDLVSYNKKKLYSILFQAVWETLKKLGADPKLLGGMMGAIMVLHTWGQNLLQHNHLHCIVPGGALKKNGEWISSSEQFLFPVKVMSKLFKGAYVSKLREAYKNNELKLPDTLPTPQAFDKLLDDLMDKDWVVYAKAPFAGPEKLLGYLGRYTHKIAISNHRILSCDENWVRFKWRDYADDNKEKIMKLHPHEFIRRFLSHVLPKGFMRIRSYGYLSNAVKKEKVELIQKQLNFEPPKVEKRNTEELMRDLTGRDISICSGCKKGKLHLVGLITSEGEIKYFPEKDSFDTS